MRAQGVRRVPVVDDAGTLLGILAVDDLLELFAGHLASIVALIAGSSAWSETGALAAHRHAASARAEMAEGGRVYAREDAQLS